MSDTLTVKAFLKADQTSEIRRFAVDQTVCASLTYLGGKITQVFPKLTNKQYSLFWKDSDGDLISFSTDDELTDALGFVSDGIFRIYIHPAESIGGAGLERNEPCHKGVLCDRCEAEICGPRFKCITCPDYDLCYKCEATGIHENHDMLRMCSPRPMGSMNFAFGHPHPPPPPPGGHHGHHHPPPPPPPPPPHGEGHPFPPHHGPPFWGPGMWHWKRMMKRCWKKWMREGGDPSAWPYGPEPNSRDPSEDGSRYGDEPTGKDPRVETEQMQKEKDQKSRNENENAGEECNSRESSTAGRDSNEEYLRSMGDSVADMLDPLGIDVQVDVEHNNQRCNMTGGRGRHCRRGRGGPWNWANFAGPWGGAWAGSWGRGGRGGSWSWAGQRGGAHTFGRQASQEDDVEMMQEAEQQAQTAPAPSEQRAPGTPKSSQDMSMGSPAPQSESSENGEWTVLGKEKEGANMDTDKLHDPDAAQVVYPTLPSASSSNPRIVEALEQMQAMGYTDDGGWLTGLLETKGGDINKVLDSLQPKPQ